MQSLFILFRSPNTRTRFHLASPFPGSPKVDVDEFRKGSWAGGRLEAGRKHEGRPMVVGGPRGTRGGEPQSVRLPFPTFTAANQYRTNFRNTSLSHPVKRTTRHMAHAVYLHNDNALRVKTPAPPNLTPHAHLPRMQPTCNSKPEVIFV